MWVPRRPEIEGPGKGVADGRSEHRKLGPCRSAGPAYLRAADLLGHLHPRTQPSNPGRSLRQVHQHPHLSGAAPPGQHTWHHTRDLRRHRTGGLPRERTLEASGAPGDGSERRSQLPDPDDLRLLHARLAGCRAVVPGGPARRHGGQRGHPYLSGVHLCGPSGAAALPGGHNPLWRGDLALGYAAQVGRSALRPDGVASRRRFADRVGSDHRERAGSGSRGVDCVDGAARTWQPARGPSPTQGAVTGPRRDSEKGEEMTTSATTPSRATTSAFPLKYVLVAFAFTWFFWLLAILEARGLISSLPVPAMFFGSFGPMVAAVVITAQESGRAGLRSLLSRIVRWRVAPFWYSVARLGPIVVQLVAMALHVVLGGQPPDLSAMVGVLPTVLVSFVYMLIQVGIGEEVGWRGYALPKLQAGYSALLSSVVLGVIWTLWHLPLFFNPATGYSITPFWVFLIFMLPVSILITWVFNSTAGSVPIIMILHAVLNASGTPMWRSIPEYGAMETPTVALVTYTYLLQAAVLWAAAAVVVLAYGATNLSRRPRVVPADAEVETRS